MFVVIESTVVVEASLLILFKNPKPSVKGVAADIILILLVMNMILGKNQILENTK